MEGWWLASLLACWLGGTPVARAKIRALSTSSVLRSLSYRRQVCISESRLASLSPWTDRGASEPAVAAPYWSSFSYGDGGGGCGGDGAAFHCTLAPSTARI